jgi:hypothetical protein
MNPAWSGPWEKWLSLPAEQVSRFPRNRDCRAVTLYSSSTALVWPPPTTALSAIAFKTLRLAPWSVFVGFAYILLRVEPLLCKDREVAGYTRAVPGQRLGTHYIKKKKLILKCSVLRNLTPCSLLKVSRRFGRICRINLNDLRICEAVNQNEASNSRL